MTAIPETHLDLLDAPIATLATIGPDGRPQVSPLWFLNDEGTIKISLNRARQKTKNLQANPAVTLQILDPSGFKYVEVRADATVDDDSDYVFADKVGAKYNADLRQMDGPGESRVVVTLHPVKVNAVNLAG